MNFCEGCNLAFNENRCPKCGRKKVRAVTDEDFCLVGRVDRLFGENLKEQLKGENIDCVLMPYGSGVSSKFALPLNDCLLYVRYKNIEKVRTLLHG